MSAKATKNEGAFVKFFVGYR